MNIHSQFRSRTRLVAWLFPEEGLFLIPPPNLGFSNQIMTKLLVSPTSGDNPGSSLSPAVLCKYLSHSMAVDQCDDLITSSLFHNTNCQPSILIYCFLRDGAENEAVVSQELNNESRTAAFCDFHPLKSCIATGESTKQRLLVNSRKVNE